MLSSHHLLLLHDLSPHVLLELLYVLSVIADLPLEVGLELVHPLDLLPDELDTFLHVVARFVHVLLRKHGAHQLEDGGVRTHKLELLEHHLVLRLLLH